LIFVLGSVSRGFGLGPEKATLKPMSTNNSKVKNWLTVKNHWFTDTSASGSFNKNFARIKELGRQRTALDQLAGVLHVQ